MRTPLRASLVAAAVLLAVPLRAAEPRADLSGLGRDLAPFLHLSGTIATRYLWQPSLKREGIEYLYYAGIRAIALETRDFGFAFQSYLDSFDTKKNIKGFAGTGQGTIAAEPIFNVNVLYADAYAVLKGHRVGARFGVQPVELPTFQLPRRCVQVADFAGLRSDVDLGSGFSLGAVAGNLDAARRQEFRWQIGGVQDRWNYMNYWLDRRGRLGATRAGVYAFDPAFKGYKAGATSLFVQHDAPMLRGRLTPSLYARYFTDYDLWTDVVASVEGRVLHDKLWLKPGYIYLNRSARAIPLPNSNYFAPGVDHNLLFLYVESPLPRASDSIYAAVTTGAKRFMAQQGTRFEAGVFLRFARIPGLP